MADFIAEIFVDFFVDFYAEIFYAFFVDFYDEIFVDYFVDFMLRFLATSVCRLLCASGGANGRFYARHVKVV